MRIKKEPGYVIIGKVPGRTCPRSRLGLANRPRRELNIPETLGVADWFSKESIVECAWMLRD